jgi:hypothetical protein
VVSACVACNRRKAGKTPNEAGMRLTRQPLPPHGSFFFHLPHHQQQTGSEWQKYLYQKNEL